MVRAPAGITCPLSGYVIVTLGGTESPEGVGVAAGGTGVLVGVRVGVAVGGSGVLVRVGVGGTGVLVGVRVGVAVGGIGVLVGVGIGVFVAAGKGVVVGVRVGPGLVPPVATDIGDDNEDSLPAISRAETR
jgi:hypothetical protein